MPCPSEGRRVAGVERISGAQRVERLAPRVRGHVQRAPVAMLGTERAPVALRGDDHFAGAVGQPDGRVARVVALGQLPERLPRRHELHRQLAQLARPLVQHLDVGDYGDAKRGGAAGQRQRHVQLVPVGVDDVECRHVDPTEARLDVDIEQARIAVHVAAPRVLGERDASRHRVRAGHHDAMGGVHALLPVVLLRPNPVLVVPEPRHECDVQPELGHALRRIRPLPTDEGLLRIDPDLVVERYVRHGEHRVDDRVAYGQHPRAPARLAAFGGGG
mmetsp:Transcript_88718/g.271680  ORF Transcript_88718/g.271680 Transcript_88718/m.271680 type:complete len:274 (+) Transcript_88718:695-1516(+)